jgi:hypothetical protein
MEEYDRVTSPFERLSLMSRVFTDHDLLSWEAYSSGGKWGLPDAPNIVFNCLSDPDRPARFVPSGGSTSDAEREVSTASIGGLQEMLAKAEEL